MVNRFGSILPAVLAMAMATAALAQQAPLPPAPEAPADSKLEAPPAAAPPSDQQVAQDLLDRLFGQLHGAKDETSAKVIEDAIWKLWAHSGSPTADALIVQAVRAMEANQRQTALRILDTVIDDQPTFAEAWNKRATLFYMMGDYDRSLADIDHVLELEPRHFGALTGLGTILSDRGKKAEALKAFRRALSIHPFLEGAKKALEQIEPETEQKI
ncbi:MAG: tetratricopeptide repeat protein [Aestuariivirgaceae bacterium]